MKKKIAYLNYHLTSLTSVRLSFVVFLLVITMPTGAREQQSRSAGGLADTLSICFRQDSISIDLDYADNGKVWQRFCENFEAHYKGADSRALRLDIYSGASPEGTAAHNRWLGENRGVALRRLIRHRFGDKIGGIIVHNEGARWEGLYDAVAACQEPWRDEVLDIIEQPASVNENRRDYREDQLRRLHNGEVWSVLQERYMTSLRSGATAILSWRTDTIIVRDTVFMPTPVFPPNMVYVDSIGDIRRMPDSTKVLKPVLREPTWILRTNLPLLGFGLTPNLQAEWSLDHKDRWSLNVEFIWPWWIFSHNAYANQVMFGGVELRRYLGRRWRHHTLDGWHIGLAAGGGYYDLEWKSRGYQGEAFMTYINIGWQRRFGKRKQWAFDAGIGVGYLYSPYRRYLGSSLFPEGHEERYDDHLMWQETSRLNWFATPHANISIGYCFPQPDSKWKRQEALEREVELYAYRYQRDSVIMREKFVRDSMRLADRLAVKEAKLLPKEERKAALKQIALEKRQKESALKAARRQAKIESREAKRKERQLAREMKQQSRREKALLDSIAREEKQSKREQWESLSDEQRQQLKAEQAKVRQQEEAKQKAERDAEKAAKRQAKAEKKRARREASEAKRKAKAERKLEKRRARIEEERKRGLEKLERQTALPTRNLLND